MQVTDLFDEAVKHHMEGAVDAARSLYVRVLSHEPNHSGALGNLAVLEKGAGNFVEAEKLLHRSLAVNPRNTAALTTLANLHLNRKRYDLAFEYASKALEINPEHANALVNLGVALVHRKRVDLAEEAFSKALALAPEDTNARLNLANCQWLLRKNLQEAQRTMERLVYLDPQNHVALNCLAIAYRESKRPWKAMLHVKEACRLKEDEAYLSILGNILIDFGDFNEGAKSYRRALAIDPTAWDAYDNLLFALNYDDRLSAEQVYREYEAYGVAVRTATARRFDHAGRAPISGRRIRIGYSSPDFRGHACRFFMEPIFRNHDRNQFELFAYANTAEPDHHTERLKGYFDHWVDVLRLSDEEMAQRIYNDQIDILIDLAGHTGGNRLLAFAMRPAPIQASYLGYGYTTGLKEVDYFIGDENLTPVGSEAYFSEQLWRIPAPNYTYEPPREITPEVAELPALRKGYVTFGSLSRTVRLNDPLLRVWKEILDRVPGSRLRLDQKPFFEEETRELFWQRLERIGISRERVELTYSHPHWAAYQDIDITLDCWPHNAGTTTLESLWMGVPVLSKIDRPSVGCVGVSLLKPVGLEDWVVKDEAAYIEKAVAFAADLGRLAQLRTSLRQRLESSPLMNAVELTQKLENAYRQMLSTESKVASLDSSQINMQLAAAFECWRKGDALAARQQVHAILVVMPEQPDAWHLKGLIALASGDLDTSWECLARAIKLQPRFAEFHVSLARWHIARNDAISALESLESALQLDPNKQVALQLKAALQERLQQAQSVAPSDVANTSKRISPKQEGRLGQLVETALRAHQSGKLKEAEQGYRKALGLNPQYFPAMKLLGTCLLQQGDAKSARELLQAAAAVYEQDAEVFDHLGTSHASLGDREAALQAYLRATALNPAFDAAWNNLGMLYKDLGKSEQAEQCYQKALAANPKMVEALNNYGNLLLDQKRDAEAEAMYERVIAIQPSYPFPYLNLGNLRKNQERFEEAESLYRKALGLKKNLLEGWLNLAIVLNSLKRHLEAKQSAISALKIKGNYARALNQLGVIEQELGNEPLAEGHYRAAIESDPAYAEAYNNLGTILGNQKRWKESREAYLKALELRPDYAIAWCNLGGMASRWKRQHEAIAYFNKALEIQADYPEAVSNLATVYQDLAELPKAIETFKKAIAIGPQHWHIRDNLLFALNYDDRLSAEQVYREYEAYGVAVRTATARRFDHAGRAPISGRRIRIGYSSPDFRGHACRFFMEPIFRNHDRNQFELFAYANTAEPDHHTERLKGYFDHWVDVLRLSDEEMAQRIYNDQIDILIDLAGHTGGNRLLAFAMRPAPIQASYLGYGYTTGLKEVDYFIGDENLTPVGSEAYFSEQLWRIPAPNYTYEPPREITPEVAELPALRKGYVTFGSLSRTVRLNDPLLRVWKEILDRVPGSRLRLDQKPFFEEETRELFWQRLERIGISRERVELTYSHPHWAAYQDIDITLDCWPHNAGTTTLESLWMGVPVLSKIDRPSVGCVGVSLLKPVGLEDWVVKDEAAYIEKAVAFAADLGRLAQLRTSLRQRLESSPLMNAVELTQKLENAYRQMVKK